jgi:hypothetical protein
MGLTVRSSRACLVALILGGNWNNAGQAGMFCFNSNNAASNVNTNIGCRLFVWIKSFARLFPHRLVKILPQGQGLVSRKDLNDLDGKQGATMKRIGHLYEKMCDPKTIQQAIISSAKSKRHRHVVQRVLADIDGHTEIIRNLLVTQTYIPAPYLTSERLDHRCKKLRKIQRPKYFPDQVIHWVVVIAIQDVLMRGMYYWCCGSVPDRGTKHGHKILRRWLDKDRRGTKYCLKLDVKRFYESIPHDKLMLFFSRKIKDKKALWIIGLIIKTNDKGVPIGNYTSQWFANCYLELLDHYIKEQLGIKYYIRYIDDFVLLGANKKKLHRALKLIVAFLETELGLTIKENWQVFPVKARGIDFLGYVFFHTHTVMRGRNFISLTRQCNRVKRKQERGEPIPYKMAAGLLSRAGQMKHCDSQYIKEKYYHGINERELKEVIRRETKRQLQARAA